jgi:hypothetical protein
MQAYMESIGILKEAGIVLTAMGDAGLLYILFEIITDITGELVHYSYMLPLAHHEISNLAFLALGLILRVAIVTSWRRETK